MSAIQNFDPAGAAKWLGVSKTTVRLMLKDGRLPFSRVGRRIVIQLKDLQELLTSTREQPAVQPPVHQGASE